MTAADVWAADAVIIGGGIAGAGAAYELAQAMSVFVVEREMSCGYHSTGRSAASFTENYGNSIVRRLVIASRDFLERPPAAFAGYPLMDERGIVTIARGDQLDLLAAELARAREWVPSMTEIAPREALIRVPILRPESVAAAIFEPHSRELDVDGLHQGFLKGAKARGARLLVGTEVQSIVRRHGLWRVRTPQAEITASILVNAAGAWADAVAALAGIARLGLTPKRRTAFNVDGPPGVRVSRWPMVQDVGGQLYFKPSAGQLLVSPADAVPHAPADVQPEDEDVAVGVERLERVTTLNVRRVSHAWAGLRTFAPDQSPVVGPDAAAPGFFWLAGQGGYGIKTSPALARALASLVCRGELPDDLRAAGVRAEELSPERLRQPSAPGGRSA